MPNKTPWRFNSCNANKYDTHYIYIEWMTILGLVLDCPGDGVRPSLEWSVIILEMLGDQLGDGGLPLRYC